MKYKYDAQEKDPVMVTVRTVFEVKVPLDHFTDGTDEEEKKAKIAEREGKLAIEQFCFDALLTDGRAMAGIGGTNAGMDPAQVYKALRAALMEWEFTHNALMELEICADADPKAKKESR